MEQYISKSALVAELNRLIAELVEEGEGTMFEQGRISAFKDVKMFVNHTLEVKEVYEWNDVNLNPLFEEMGVEPDSRIASMFKNAFYKAVDNYLERKENKL